MSGVERSKKKNQPIQKRQKIQNAQHGQQSEINLSQKRLLVNARRWLWLSIDVLWRWCRCDFECARAWD